MQIINGNALDELKKLPDGSVNCIVTSPPYYGLRSYKGAETIWGGDPKCEHNFEIKKYYTRGQSDKATTDSPIKGLEKKWEEGFCSKCGAWKGQLGLEPTYQMYLGHLLMVTRELKRVLKETGTLFWNMGDSYAGKMGKRQGWNDNKIAYTKEEALENGTSFYLSADYGNIQDKSLMMIPERFAVGMIDQGWILRNKIIWFKRNGLPSSVRDRFSNKWEYIFFFVKSKKYYFDLNAVRVPPKTGYKPFNYHVREAILGRLNQKFGDKYSASEEEKAQYDRQGVRIYNSKTLDTYLSPQDPMYLKQKLIRDTSREVVKELFPNDQEKQQEIVNFIDDHYSNPKGANPGDVLQVNTKPHRFAHFAVFPETLVEPLIKAGCPENGVVLDPFAGSGTVGVVAKRLNRDAILIEISEKYVEIIKQRLTSSPPKIGGSLPISS